MPIGQFALVFSLAYAALKWNYIIPLIWNQSTSSNYATNLKKLKIQNWIFAIAGLAATLAQNLLNYKSISKETSYLMGLVSLFAVIAPHSNAWMAAATALHLELINICTRGPRNQKIAAGVTLGLVFIATTLNAKKTIVQTLKDYATILLEN